jgi:Prolyl oligopeptidase family
LRSARLLDCFGGKLRVRGRQFQNADDVGSAGYGRAYRLRLERRWGIVDGEDCAAGARFLVENRTRRNKRRVTRASARLALDDPDARRWNDRSKARGAEFVAKKKISALVSRTKEDSRALKAHSKSKDPGREGRQSLEAG